MDEERLELALGEVGDDHAEAEPLGWRHGRVLQQVRPGGDGGAVDEDGAQVLDDEDGSPCDLDA